MFYRHVFTDMEFRGIFLVFVNFAAPRPREESEALPCPFFALSYFVFEGHFQVQASRGGLYLEGRFIEGVFVLRVWGAHTWRGLFWNFTVSPREICKLLVGSFVF